MSSRPPDHVVISPALKSRWVFKYGQFKLIKTWYGFKITRIECYEHQVLWNTSPDWVTTFEEFYSYKVDSFVSNRIADTTLYVLGQQFKATDHLYPKELGDVLKCIENYSLDLSNIRHEVKLYLKNI